MNEPKTEQDFREFYEGALAYLGILVGELVGADSQLVNRADQHMREIRNGGVSPFLQPMQQRGAYWARELAVLKVDERREAAEASSNDTTTQDDREPSMETRNLPDDPAEAVRMLALEVNRLSGQLAGLTAFIQSLGFQTNVPQQDLVKRAHEILPPQLKPSGPFTGTDHAGIKVAALLDTFDLP